MAKFVHVDVEKGFPERTITGRKGAVEIEIAREGEAQLVGRKVQG